MEKKKNKKKFSISAFSIILILIFILALSTVFLPQAEFIKDPVTNEQTIVDGSGVVKASFAGTLMSPIKGFVDAIDICLFVLVLGGFLKIVNDSGALETGIKVLIRKLNGKELILIPILMTLFSIGGSTYGMLEETVGFYALLSAAMVVAGMDTLVASAVVLLGAGAGCLGSTINPFAVGAIVDAAKSALPEGTVINQAMIIGIGIALWITTLLISIIFVMAYARRVMKKKGSTILSLQEQQDMKEHYGKRNAKIATAALTGRQKVTLLVFVVTFIVMIIGFIPWGDFGITIFDKTENWLTKEPLGKWYFQEATLWFLISSIVIGLINKLGEQKLIDSFIAGCGEMMSVVLIIAVARGASVLMTETYLHNYIIVNAANALKNVPPVIFAPINYILHVGLSILVPSSSGLAALSGPIMAPLAHSANFNIEATLMGMVAANGLVNLFTPTCGAIMGGLALAKVEYSTWLKWVTKVIVVIAIVNITILTFAMMILK